MGWIGGRFQPLPDELPKKHGMSNKLEKMFIFAVDIKQKKRL
jgi:hypothetical protein